MDAHRVSLDGVLAAQRPASGHPLQQTDIPCDIGHIAGGSARFTGTIDTIYLANTARDAGWIAAAYRAPRG